MKTLRLLLGDQLNSQHSWFDEVNHNVMYVMAEMRQETDYVKHHIQKAVAFFLSMRNFSEELTKHGHQVVYYKISDANNPQDLERLILDLIEKNKIEQFEYQYPDEYRLDKQLKAICEKLSISTKAVDSEHFYTSRNELADFFKGKKQFLMESFYRMMRKKHDVLMVGDQPLDGRWNFDHNNRNQYKNEVPIPFPLEFHENVSEIVAEIESQNITTFGSIDAENFNWPTSRNESLQLVDYFCEHLLAHFGTYQDSLFSGHKFLFHSRLSFAMNSKMISPKEVVDAVISYYYQNQETIELAQVEGFVRQIIGWREYIRGIYWKEMPNYAQMNTLENNNPLPDFFWTGKTKMKCMQHSISQSLSEAYAHHIQRLMVIGNFSLLAQLHPDAVDAWYLGVYIDAIEWVEMPNTRGMSQYADGGIVATKPYVSSGSYINKMSNYCGSCHYNVKDKLGEKACPFNSLYWHFLDEKKHHFANNQRMSMMLALLRKMKPEELAATKEKAISILEDINNL
ncbi:MAG TPA: cryptochrome/photolyase family protein [Flavobacterium sp.]|uniref:cryptochrome/photolyase family protein n=1 Tax=Flavobacterium sp. TaxID=239 RepID=UPI002B4B8741|nr:cryptochrome/photolyase family protein [Flavobacterium sp.]HLO72888.1 cryptochrome/photolyase family protein [Flavobacterium sp.]